MIKFLQFQQHVFHLVLVLNQVLNEHALNYISFYATLSPILFPIKAIVILMFSLCFVLAGKKVFGKHSKYLAL